MDVKAIRRSIRVGELMRPYITESQIENYAILAQTFFEAVAQPEHYKTIFRFQNKGDLNVHEAIYKLMTEDVKFNKMMMDYANNDEHFSVNLKLIVRNIKNYKEIVIPTRKCDFKVGDGNDGTTWFYIEERLEVYLTSNRFTLAKLHVDEKSDELLYYDTDEGWNTYAKSDEFNEAYKSWLADEQLLKD
mgnify:CR=1 FL=1